MNLQPLGAFALFFSIAPAAAQTRVHVPGDPQQVSRADESATSIGAALERVAQARRAGDSAPKTILLGDRTYRLTRPIALDSALVAEGLTLAAEPGAQPVLFGGRPIEGFVAQEDGTWSVTIDAVRAGHWWFEQLFVGGRRATRARHPNSGFARVVKAGPDDRTSFRFDPKEIPSALIDPAAEVVFLHDWSISRVRVAAVDPVSHTIRVADPIGCSAPHFKIDNFEAHPRFFLEGSPRLLDSPGEWALDRASGKLSYRPLAGESIDTLEVTAPLATGLLAAQGTREKPLSHLVLRGLRFRCSAWPVPSHGYAEGQASFFEARDGKSSGALGTAVPAAIELKWARHCTLENCIVEGTGGSGIWIGAGCRDCLVQGSIVRDTGANGILIGEDATRMLEGRPWWQSAPEQVAHGNSVRKCLVERAGRRFFGAVGIWIGLADKTSVTRCELRDLPYTGISVGWRWDAVQTPCRENLIADNHIHALMQTLSDGGGIYTLGRQAGTVLRHNAIHDIAANAGRAPSNGIFFDQGSSATLTEKNVFWNIARTPLRWHWTYANRVAKNTFFLRPGQKIATYNRAGPKDIDYQDNRTLAAGARPADVPNADAKAIIAAAGPSGARALGH